MIEILKGDNIIHHEKMEAVEYKILGLKKPAAGKETTKEENAPKETKKAKSSPPKKPKLVESGAGAVAAENIAGI